MVFEDLKLGEISGVGENSNENELIGVKAPHYLLKTGAPVMNTFTSFYDEKAKIKRVNRLHRS